MNIQIFNIIKNAVLNVLSSHKEKINPLDEKPKSEILILMDQYDEQKINKN